MSFKDMIRSTMPQRAPQTKAEAEKAFAEAAQLREDAKAILEMRLTPGWIRLERLIQEQIGIFREELEDPTLQDHEIRARQWQVHALRWLIELPDVLQRKIQTDEMIEAKTVREQTGGPP